MNPGRKTKITILTPLKETY